MDNMTTFQGSDEVDYNIWEKLREELDKERNASPPNNLEGGQRKEGRERAAQGWMRLGLSREVLKRTPLGRWP